MKNEQNVPQVRFKVFTDAWEQRKLGDVTESIRNGYSYKADGSRDHTYKITRIESISTGVINTDKLGSSDEINQSYRLQDGDILFSHINSLQYIANTALYTSKLGEIYHGMNLLNIRSKSDYINSHFLLHLLKIESNREWFRTVAKPAVNQASISTIEVGSFEFLLPNLEEQQVIADFFDNLDNLITLHQRKCETLQKLKKSMLQKMFPKNGSLYPEIRFAGFTDAWEQRKLLSCIQSITDFRGRTPKKLGMDWSESGYLALSALNVKDGYIDFSQDVHYGNQELYDKWMSGKELHRGQVLFTTEAPMGNVAQVPDNKGYILSQRTIAFDVEEEILSENFLATLLRTPNVFNDLTALSSGGTAKGVSQKSLSGLDVVIPKNIDEQNKLADYFINLDNLITLHQRKLETLQKLKKSMLQKMFI